MVVPRESTFTRWQAFTCLCSILADLHPEESGTHLAGADAWPDAIGFAKSQGCLPALASRLAENPELRQWLPESHLPGLLQAHRSNTQRNLEIFSQTHRLILALNQASIKPVLLKGAAGILEQNSRDMGFRWQADIDLYIEPDELAEACNVMFNQGYRFVPMGPDGALNATDGNEDLASALILSKAHHHLPPLISPNYTAIIEVHTQVLPNAFHSRQFSENFAATVCEQENRKACFRIPSRENRLIHIVLGTYLNDGWAARYDFPLKGALDFLALTNAVAPPGKELDATYLRTICGKQFEVFNALVGALLTAESVLPVSSARLKTMKMRYEHRKLRRLLDGQARVRRLSRMLVTNPGKLPGYLNSIRQ